MDVRTIVGWTGAGVVGVAGFFGVDNAEHVVDFYKDKTIAVDSREASFLIGDWCGLSGERQRFERRGDSLVLFSCVPGEGAFCGPESFGAGAKARTVKLGWAESHLTYRLESEKAAINVNQIDAARFQAYLSTGLGFSEWRRCTPEDDAAKAPEPEPVKLAVEAFTPTAPLFVKGDAVQYRVAPFATEETPVAMTAKAGEPVTVVGRILQLDGYWYEARLPGGTPAFIRADFVTDVAPVVAPEPVPEPAAPPPIEEPRMRAGADALPPVPRALRNMSGTVKVEMCVAVDGRVTKADIATSSGRPKLDAAVLKWLQNARFEPATQGGAPIEFCGYSAEYIFKGGR